MDRIITFLAGLIIALISKLGYLGIIIAMAIESASIPLPSEVIMPFSGYLVFQGRLNLILVSLTGAFGCLVGSYISWWLGKAYGEEVVRFLIRRYGKYVLVFEYELDDAIKIFAKYGDRIIFISRLLPMVRTFISLPAGIAEMDGLKFGIYTFFGSLIWSFILAWVGLELGSEWNSLGTWFHKFDLVIIISLVVLLILYVWHKLHRHHAYKKKQLKKIS